MKEDVNKVSQEPKLDEAPKQEESSSSKDTVKTTDKDVEKELSELRKFKSDVLAKERETTAKQKEEATKEVKVSDSFFSKNEEVVKQSTKKISSTMKHLLDNDVAYKEE